MKTMTLLALTAGIIGYFGEAKAAVYSYTVNDDQDSSKSITFNLTLNVANTAATSAIITGSTGGIVYDSTDFISYNIENNSFTVDNGVITYAWFSSSYDSGSNNPDNFNKSLSIHSFTKPAIDFRPMFYMPEQPPAVNYSYQVYNYSKSAYTSQSSMKSTEGVPGVVSAVPEPSALALLGLGAMGLVARRRRTA